MSDTIRVDEDELKNQIDALKTLCSDTKLQKEISDIRDTIDKSTGDSASHISSYHSHVEGISEALSALFSRTLDFLKNTNTEFIRADKGLADRIKNGEE